MTVWDAEYVRRVRELYRAKQNAVDELVVMAMLEAYEAITGQKPKDSFREKIEEAVAYDA